MKKNTNIKKLENNIWKLYLCLVSYSFMFFVPIIVLFYQENGLSLTQIMIIQSVYFILFVLLEVPSGYFADIFGRKKALMLTGIFGSISMFTFAISTNFYHFLLAIILWATAGAFISGADSALLYDTLKDLKRDKEYKKIWGNVVFYYMIGVSFASIVGGLVGKIDYRYPFYLAMPFMILLIPLSLSLYEPQRHKTIFTKNYLLDLLKVIKLTLLKNNKLKWILIYSAVLTSFISTSYLLYQPYFQLSGLDIAYFGVVFAGFYAISGLSAKYSHLIEEKIGQKYSLILLVLLVGISYFLMSNLIYLFSFAFAFLFQFAKGFSSVVISDYINKLADSKTRATVLSIESLITKIASAVLSPFIGWIADIYSLEQAFNLSGILVLFFGAISLVLFWKSKSIRA